MTRDLSRGEEFWQSRSMINRKKMIGVLLAVVSVLSASLGVTAAQAAGEVEAHGGSAPKFKAKIAQAGGSPSLQTFQYKPQKGSNQTKTNVSNQKKSAGKAAINEFGFQKSK